MADEKNIATEDEEEGGEGGGKKKLFIIIGAAVLLLVIAGVAAFLFMGGEEEGEPKAEEAEPMYLELEPTFVVNLAPGGDAGMLQVAIEIMTRNPTVVETLTANDPMIRHHILVILEEQKSKDLMMPEGRLSLQQAIHEMLNAKLKELEELGQVHGVFFTQFVMQ